MARTTTARTTTARTVTGLLTIAAFSAIAAAQATGPLVCSISECRGFSPGAALSAATANSWARNEIWSFTEEVLQVVGLQPNFELIETTAVGNAAAVIHQQKRILAYNPEWVGKIDRTHRWPMYGLLAHEIGHHLQGHTLLPGGSKPPTELEADRFAGFALARLGATEAEALQLWQTLPVTGSSTHPARADRLAVVTEGWRKAMGARPPAQKSPPVAESKGGSGSGNGAYVIADSATRTLSPRDIEALSPVMLRIARNEIFARHGFEFESSDLAGYFGARSWYSPRGRNVSLSAVEKANVDLIRKRETALGGEVVEKGVVLMHSSVRLLSREEVQRLTPAQRRLARNEIFARRGYIFNDPQLAAHFRTMPWYRPTRASVELSAVEEANVRLIRGME